MGAWPSIETPAELIMTDMPAFRDQPGALYHGKAQTGWETYDIGVMVR
jgi:hypothetical protein